MYRKLPRALVITGLALLFLAVALTAYTLIDDYLAGRRARDLLEQMPSAPVTQLAASDSAGEGVNAALVPGETAAPATAESWPEAHYDTAGVLTISKLGLELPVLSDCNESALKVSVCLYSGDADKAERLIVAGHNYKSHFGNLSRLAQGDEVWFTNSDGIKYRYTVTEITEITPDDYKTLMRGEWDVTLLTCNADWSTRILVRCSKAQA